MLWVARSEAHPLRTILKHHIMELSWKRWHTRDLAWLVSLCGHIQGEGSATWQHICKSWAGLKKFLHYRQSVNVEEWRALPLWTPHRNQRSFGSIPKLSRAQSTMRDSGLLSMGDITNLPGQILPWDVLARRGIPDSCRRAFQALGANLKSGPDLNPSLDVYKFYVEDFVRQLAWQFLIPPAHCTVSWIPFMDCSSPQRSFIVSGRILIPSALCTPEAHANLRRIVVQAPKGHQQLSHCGEWKPENLLLTQYQWNSGLPLLESSTTTLRCMQNTSVAASHVSLQKWVTQLGTPLPFGTFGKTHGSALPRKILSFGKSLSTGQLQHWVGVSRTCPTRTLRCTVPDATSMFGRMWPIAYGSAMFWLPVGGGAIPFLAEQLNVSPR